MQLTGELAPLGYAHRETEFIIAPVGPVAGSRIFGACGPTALASAASAALQRLVTSEQVYALMQPRGLCDAQGITDDRKIASAAVLPAPSGLGLTIAEHYAYSPASGGDTWAGWATFLGWHLGSRDHPTVVELARGQALVDAISGNGENASGLTYHFICLIKRHEAGPSAAAGGRTLPSGYWACDGDNYAGGNNRTNGFAASDALQFYSDTTLAAAMPCAAIAFNRAPVAAQTGAGTGAGTGTTGGTTPMWHQMSASPLIMADSHGVQAQHGMATYLAAHATLGDVVSGCPGETYVDAATSILPLDGDVSLVYTASDQAVHTDKSGQVLWALHQQLTAAQAEIAALKNTPPPAPLTTQQQNDLAAMAAIRAALA